MKPITAWLLAAWILGVTAWFVAQPYVGQALDSELSAAKSALELLLGGGQ